MIALATFIAVETWRSVNREDEPTSAEGVITLMILFGLVWFDLRMAEIIAGGLA